MELEGLIEIELKSSASELKSFPKDDWSRKSLDDRVKRLRSICSLMFMLQVAFTAAIYNADSIGLYCQSTYLWRVDSNHHLFGTMHVHPNEIKLPEEMKKAFSQSDAAYFETDSHGIKLWSLRKWR